MSDPLQIVFEDTPQLWRAYYDPEGIQGFGKTREAARMDLLEQTDERWSEALEKNVRHLARIAELEGLLSQTPRWIPVGKRLPTDSELVLGSEGDRETTTMYYWPYPTNRAGNETGKWYYPERTTDQEVRPTHWMPLPEAPK